MSLERRIERLEQRAPAGQPARPLSVEELAAVIAEPDQIDDPYTRRALATLGVALREMARWD